METIKNYDTFIKEEMSLIDSSDRMLSFLNDKDLILLKGAALETFDDSGKNHATITEKLEFSNELINIWSKYADFEFFKKLIKIHGVLHYEKRLEHFLLIDNNSMELSANGKINFPIDKFWGDNPISGVGTIIEGDVIFAGNITDKICSGTYGDRRNDTIGKIDNSLFYKKISIRMFKNLDTVILDRESFQINNPRQNELFVKNWKIKSLIIGARTFTTQQETFLLDISKKYKLNIVDKSGSSVNFD